MRTESICSRTLASIENCCLTPPAHLPVDWDPRVSRSSSRTSTLRLASWYARAQPMTPPPAMTTSALSMAFGRMPGGAASLPFDPPHLEYQLEGRERRDVAVVVGRRHFDQVEAHELQSIGGGGQEVQRLPARQTARRWDLGARRERGVKDVDVERH